MRRFYIQTAVSLVGASGFYHYVCSKHEKGGNIESLPAAENPLLLEQVHIVFRHGARTVTKLHGEFSDIPNIPPANWDRNVLLQKLSHVDIAYDLKSEDGSEILESWMEKHSNETGPLPGGCHYAQMTTVGQESSYDLGRWIGQEYIKKHKLISPVFSNDQVYTRTTNTPRTIMTAKCVLAGIFGKDSFKDSPKIQTRARKREDMAPNFDYCQLTRKWIKTVFEQLQDSFEGHQEFRKKLSKSFDMKDDNKPLHFIAWYDYMTCRMAHGMFVPEILLQHRNMIEKYSAELFGYLIDGDNRATPKLRLYSTHDTTLIALLMTFDVWKSHMPPFSSSICVEVYKNIEDERRYVRVLYNKESLNINPDNEGHEYVSLEKFLEKLDKYRAQDWNKECKNHVIE